MRRLGMFLSKLDSDNEKVTKQVGQRRVALACLIWGGRWLRWTGHAERGASRGRFCSGERCGFLGRRQARRGEARRPLARVLRGMAACEAAENEMGAAVAGPRGRDGDAHVYWFFFVAYGVRSTVTSISRSNVTLLTPTRLLPMRSCRSLPLNVNQEESALVSPPLFLPQSVA
ncbi:hypothetical protein LX36DRAFT_460693 [Colletotrichum falcatum]|nr:hypothetical protein LX36DRAFT_460693 [Colletotrichum falcatum]